jgi:hypothetical protein
MPNALLLERPGDGQQGRGHAVGKLLALPRPQLVLALQAKDPERGRRIYF